MAFDWQAALTKFADEMDEKKVPEKFSHAWNESFRDLSGDFNLRNFTKPFTHDDPPEKLGPGARDELMKKFQKRDNLFIPPEGFLSNFAAIPVVKPEAVQVSVLAISAMISHGTVSPVIAPMTARFRRATL